MIIQDRAKDKLAETHAIEAAWLTNREVELYVLRLDKLHPVVSGNKWFKLKYYLQDAKEKNFDTIATFGGAYSNHIAATAFACKEYGLKSIGMIRGERAKQLSYTLQQALHNDMQLEFVSRSDYKNKEELKKKLKNVYWVDEGGYGIWGMKGASEILQLVDELNKYTHIVSAAGTGTTLAGIIHSALPHQQVIGVSAMKGNEALMQQVKYLLSTGEADHKFFITHDYHFGGYAKYNDELLNYMNDVWEHYHLPLDFVYTAKTFYAIEGMIQQEIIPKGSKVLMIHTGGLQGNASLTSYKGKEMSN